MRLAWRRLQCSRRIRNIGKYPLVIPKEMLKNFDVDISELISIQPMPRRRCRSFSFIIFLRKIRRGIRSQSERIFRMKNDDLREWISNQCHERHQGYVSKALLWGSSDERVLDGRQKLRIKVFILSAWEEYGGKNTTFYSRVPDLENAIKQAALKHMKENKRSDVQGDWRIRIFLYGISSEKDDAGWIEVPKSLTTDFIKKHELGDNYPRIKKATND